MALRRRARAAARDGAARDGAARDGGARDGGLTAEGAHARTLALRAEVAILGCLALVVGAGLVLFGSTSDAPVDAFRLVGCALAAALAGVGLARLAAAARGRAWRRRVAAGALLVVSLAADTGIVVVTGGTDAPFWLAYLPLVLLTAVAVRAEAAVLVGAAASACLYAGSALAGPLDADATLRLALLLPLFPVVAYAASAVGAAQRATARVAAQERRRLDADLAALEVEVRRLSGGDLVTVPALPPDAHPSALALAVALADTVVATRRAVRSVEAAAQRVDADAHRLLGVTRGLAGSAQAQDGAVVEVTSTVEQLAVASGQIADSAGRVVGIAEATLVEAVQADDTVTAMADALAGLGRRVEGIDAHLRGLELSGGRIRSIVGGIDDLARMTALLSLNAAIEAARAGAHGEGFGLVSAEVARLADRARSEAQRIAGIVAAMDEEVARTREATAEGLAQVAAGDARRDDVVAALGRISAMVSATTSAAGDISVATREQRSASGDVVGAMAGVGEASARYAAGSRRTEAATAQLAAVAGEMAARVERLVGTERTARLKPGPLVPRP